MIPKFRNPQESHAHSLKILEELYEHDDFMESVDRVVDLGCGADALDMMWWVTRTTRDDDPRPLEIQCVGVDQIERLNVKHSNISYHRLDLEELTYAKKPYDVLWCHDTFQYMTNPMGCLKNWWQIAADDAMLVLSLPQSTNVEFHEQAFDLPSGCYYNHTMVSLIYMLSTMGWDCASGFFKKMPNDPWLYAIAYKHKNGPKDPKKTTWYDLADAGVLPQSAVQSLNRFGHVRQRDLVLPWLDKSNIWLGQS